MSGSFPRRYGVGQPDTWRSADQSQEGAGGQELAWAISNAMIDTSTQELLVKAADRYKKGPNLPIGDWLEMVCADGEAWSGRHETGL